MNLIVAVDGSEQSERAFEHALGLLSAMRDPGTVTVVHAVAPDVFTEGGVEEVESAAEMDRQLVVESVEDAEQRGMALLEEAETAAVARDLAAETELLYGDPIETIPEFVAAGEFDGLVVGHRSLEARYERVLGSTAKGLIERVEVPVTVVR